MKAEGNRRPRFSLRTLVLFVCLVASGLGLWYRWEPWVVRHLIQGPLVRNAVYYFTEGEDQFNALLYDTYRVRLNLKSGVRSSFQVDRGGAASISARFEQQMISSRINGVLHRYKTKYSFSAIRSPDFYWRASTFRFPYPYQEKIVIYRRRRPEWWWGIAWLWEFWLTLAFGLGLAWSLWRDWKGLREIVPDLLK